MTTNFFSPLSFVAVLDPGSKMAKNQDPGSGIKIQQQLSCFLCNGWEHYVPYRCLQISNKLCDSTLCTCGGVGGWRNRCIMLIMTLDPSWRQTLRLPPPGIEPGSPASQAGTLPKELSRQLTPVLRIRDFYPRSRILIFSHLGSWIQNSNKREG